MRLHSILPLQTKKAFLHSLLCVSFHYQPWDVECEIKRCKNAPFSIVDYFMP